MPAFSKFSLDFYDICGFGAFGAVNHFKCHFLTLGQGFKTLALDVAEVDENVSAVFFGNESKSFGVIEPFHGAF